MSSGLLIRGFGVRVPGGAPVLTWGFTTPGLFFVCPVCPHVGSVLARELGPGRGGFVKSGRDRAALGDDRPPIPLDHWSIPLAPGPESALRYPCQCCYTA
jgi:hypothetical protein